VFNVGHLGNEEALKEQRIQHHLLIFQDTMEMILAGLQLENDHMNSLLIAFGSQHSFLTRRSFDPRYWRVFGEALTDLFNDLPVRCYIITCEEVFSKTEEYIRYFLTFTIMYLLNPIK